MELIRNWRQAHKFATTWVAAFWGAFGAILTILMLFGSDLPLWVFGPLFIVMSITYAVARVTHQPGLD